MSIINKILIYLSLFRIWLNICVKFCNPWSPLFLHSYCFFLWSKARSIVLNGPAEDFEDPITEVSNLNKRLWITIETLVISKFLNYFQWTWQVSLKTIPTDYKTKWIFEKTDLGAFTLLESIFSAVSIFIIHIRIEKGRIQFNFRQTHHRCTEVWTKRHMSLETKCWMNLPSTILGQMKIFNCYE